MFKKLFKPKWQSAKPQVRIQAVSQLDAADIDDLHIIELLAKNDVEADVRLDRLRVDGGLTRSKVLMQLQADTLNTELEISENPQVGNTETWDIYNFTVDGHPIHRHLVRFQVEGRQPLDPVTNQPIGLMAPAQAAEQGWKDTVIAYPGEITRIKAKFDIAGLFVWHCHILEHEDNEMMRPYRVVAP